jgi:hypothetical protein
LWQKYGAKASPANACRQFWTVDGQAEVILKLGLFMDEELLRGKGLEPEGGEIAAIDGFALRIGPASSAHSMSHVEAVGFGRGTSHPGKEL